MPYCKKNLFNTKGLLVFFFSLWLLCLEGVGAQEATKAGITIEKVTITPGNSEVQFVRTVQVSPELEKILETGVPLFISDVIEIYKPRWYWTNKKVFHQKRTWVVYKHSLTQQWLVIDPEKKIHPISSLEKAIILVEDSNLWYLSSEAEEYKKASFNIRVRSYIDTELMNPTLLLDTINNSDWFLDSGWVNIQSSGKYILLESSGAKS